MATAFALLSYLDAGGSARAGVLINDLVYDMVAVTGNLHHASVMGLLEDWEGVQKQILAFADKPAGAGDGKLLSDVSLLNPLSPGAIFCAAANYTDHMLAMAHKLGQAPEPDPRQCDVKPYHFQKASRQTVVGPNSRIKLPEFAEQVDWEVELVAVIGREARNVSVDQALQYVAGYTVGIDLSVRDRMYMKRPNVPDASLFKTDFISMKCFDGSCPLGPTIIPAEIITNPQYLGIRLWRDDKLMQNSSTSLMVFSVAEQISYLSERMTLLPGDIVMTGTPAGTGAEQDQFLESGQVLTAWIEKIGEFRVTMI